MFVYVVKCYFEFYFEHYKTPSYNFRNPYLPPSAALQEGSLKQGFQSRFQRFAMTEGGPPAPLNARGPGLKYNTQHYNKKEQTFTKAGQHCPIPTLRHSPAAMEKATASNTSFRNLHKHCWKNPSRQKLSLPKTDMECYKRTKKERIEHAHDA
jgi:hypothetical protein